MPNLFPSVYGKVARHTRAFWPLTLCLLVLPGLEASSLSQPLFVDFNSPGEYTNQFNPWQDAGGVNGGNYDFQESPSAGVGGSGSVSIFQSTDTTAVFKGRSWDFSTNGANLTISLLVKANGQTSANKVQFGIMNTNNNGLNANAGVTFETFRFIPTAPGTWSLREQYRTAGVNTETTLNNVTVIAGRWYKFVISLTNTAGAAGSYNAACAIYDYGTDGLTPGSNVVTFPTLQTHTGQTDVTLASVWPALRAFQNAGIDDWDNFLVYSSNSVPVITQPLTNVTALSGSSANFYALADGPGSISLAWYTNGIQDSGASGFAYSIPRLDTGCSNVMVVASNNNGTATNSASLTVVAPSLAVITNLPATGIQADSATLQGQVISTGNDTPGLAVFYGPTDGGTAAGAWAHSAFLGLQGGVFAQTVSGLSPTTTYYFAAQATNAAGTVWATPSQSFVTAASNSTPAVPSVVTYHYDNARTGQNTNETVLTPANVTSSTFGRLFSYSVDGQIYAEPLYVPGLIIPGQGTHNVVFVATQHDSVYAFDADSNSGPNSGLLWHISLGTSAATPNNDFGNRYGAYHDIDPEVGITSTPVIDPASGTIYLDAFTHEGSSYFHRIHALNITNGTEQPFSPVKVASSISGTGVGSTNGILAFNPEQHLQRPALTLANGMLFVAYSGYADTDPYHGWVIGFNAKTLQQVTNYVFNTTPNATTAAYGANAGEGGIWMSGNGLSVDSSNYLYFEVGNGSFNLSSPGGTEYGDSFIKLSTTNGLAVADYFTPYNQATLAANDTDLGSGGPLLLPDSVGTATHPHLLVGCGKEGKIYLLDRDNLGHFNSTSDSQIIQELPGAVGGTWSSPAYFNNLVFYQGSGDVMKSFRLANGLFATSPVSQSSTSFGFPGATPVISANGTNNALAWVIQSDGYPGGVGILHAYNAYNLAQEVYNSSMAGTRDNPGGAIKFTLPTVVNGKVYVGADGELSVFGNGSFLAAPTISPAPGLFTNSVAVTLADVTPGAALYFTLDNSIPSTNSVLYSGPFVLTNTTAVRVMAFKPGYVPSQMVVGTFINSSSRVFSTNFVKQEFYSGALRTDIENPAFATPPTFVHYLTSFEAPSGQGNNYAQRLSALFRAPQTGNYVFFVCSDDDSDLFLSTDSTPANKHLIAQETAWSNSREWLSSGGGSVVASKRSDQFTGTAWPGGNTIHLIGGTQYYLEADHHQGGGGDNFAATFKLSTAADPANGTAPTLTGSVIGTYAYNNTFITINTEPQNAVIASGASATFSVVAVSGYLGDTSGAQGPPLLYQWQSAPAGSVTFTNIPNATGSTYTASALKPQQSGTQFQVLLTTAGVQTTSAVAVVSVGTPQLSLSPASLTFGPVIVGQTNTLTFNVSNTGGQTLIGTATTTPPFSVTGGGSFNLSGGQTGMVFVAFTPTAEGTSSNVLVFTSNGGNSTNTVTGSGALTPSASFDGTPTSGLRPLAVTFNDTSTGTITNRSWDFGDGSVSNTAVTSVVHTYNAAGTNTVVLTVAGPVGTNTQTRIGYIAITNPPPPILSLYPTNLNFGLLPVGQTNTLTFQVINGGAQPLTGTAATTIPFRITVGSPYNVAPGQTGLVSVAFSPTNSGNFSNVVAFISNGGNSTNSVVGSAAVVPLAGFTGAPTSGLSPLIVTFSDGSTGTITNRSWDFGDGSVSNTAVTAVAHTYNAAGTNTVVLTVAGPAGTNIQTRAGYIVVTNPPPVLSLSPANLSFGLLAVGQTNSLTFQVVNSGGQTLNGSAATAVPFSITAGSPYNVAAGQTGLVSVAFSPTNSGDFNNVVAFISNRGNSTNSVTGSGAFVPVAGFTGVPTSGPEPLTVSFTDNSTGTITNRFWDFGDGTTTNTTSLNLTHTYGAMGTNSVALTVTGPVGTNALTQASYIVVTNLGPVTILIQSLGNQVKLIWSNGTLQSANDVMGPYNDVTNSASPYTLPVTNAAQFFRVRVR